MIAALEANIFFDRIVPANKFVTFLNDESNMSRIKRQIWGEDAAKSVTAGQVHGLVLMMIAAGMIEPYLGSVNAKRNDLRAKHVNVHMGKEKVLRDGIEFEDFVVNNDAAWKGFNIRA